MENATRRAGMTGRLLPITATSRFVAASLAGCAALCAAPAVHAAAADDEELQKKLANPVADLITVPIQYSANLNTGPLDKTQHTLNIQPVYPLKLNQEWSLINRAIVPILSNPALASGQDRENGLGDILYQGFFSPTAKPGGLIWGVGPALQLKTATDERLGSGKWAIGPTAVALKQEGPWSIGLLATQLWSFAGDGDRQSVNQLQLQPILSYRLSPKNTIGYAGIVTANWKEDRSSQRWTVPLGVTYSILTRPKGMQPVNFVFGGGYNVIRPDDASNWFVRFQVNFIFPK
ncbi:hypothetical protein D3870_06630 [Noviherbaspirillum cavernae]|uniref:Transporter n=1 Tax=Noviherbaspirillum cavernae TaxID=2320862 RepID=A0A418WZV1_9BURK|nr:hypothetical protein [Noviherbaspirillum cavernae]RJG05736.1 hypothetical protein D3870_06630 [Noviherbaspirillum cavernae]